MNPLQAHDAELLSIHPYLIGVDEAGRGCLAGPVVAGACLLNADFLKDSSALEKSKLIKDSKQLSPANRQLQFDLLEAFKDRGLVDFEVAFGTVAEIAALNILGANRLAMQRAVEALTARHAEFELAKESNHLAMSKAVDYAHIMVDGRPLKPWPYQHVGIVKGDNRSLAIGMASIAAKVTRDRYMRTLAQHYPNYGFEKHKGYATRQHREAILANGACQEHRELFLRKVLPKG